MYPRAARFRRRARRTAAFTVCFPKSTKSSPSSSRIRASGGASKDEKKIDFSPPFYPTSPDSRGAYFRADLMRHEPRLIRANASKEGNQTGNRAIFHLLSSRQGCERIVESLRYPHSRFTGSRAFASFPVNSNLHGNHATVIYIFFGSLGNGFTGELLYREIKCHVYIFFTLTRNCFEIFISR